jgi:hypothetical protein
MNLAKLFTSEKEILEAKEHFQSLRENNDWKFLVDNVISIYIKELTEKLLSPETKWDYPQEEQEAKRLREHWIILSELPEELLKSLVEPVKEEEKSDDPYKTIKDLKR